MEERLQQERSFELRSEKVRSIVGQIPSALVRYGITVIWVVLLVLALIAYYFPYKTVYVGSAAIYTVPQSSKTDSLEVAVKLRFEGKHIEKLHHSHLSIELYNPQNSISGTVLKVSTQRDTLDRQEAIVRFASKDICALGNQTVDFRIVESSKSILQKIIAAD